MITIAQTGLLGNVGYIDSDARNFIEAHSLTDSRDIYAVNQYAIQLKANSLWTKMIGFYPLVKDVATSYKNLKNQTGTYDLIEQNANVVTYDALTGLTLNGNYLSTQLLGDTGGVSADWGGRSNQTVGFYSTYAEANNTDNDAGLRGGVAADIRRGLRFAIRKGNTSLLDMYGSSTRATYAGETDGLGLFAASYNDANIPTIWKNGASMDTGANDGVVGTSALVFGATANGTSSAFVVGTTKRYGLLFMGTRLTDAEHLTLYQIVTTIQTQTRV